MRNALGSVQSLLVVGGTSEIGLATARALVAERVREVTLAARRPDDLVEAARGLEAAGATVRRLPFDADDLDAHSAFADEAFAEGDVDCVLVTFGVLGDADRTREDRDAAVDVLRTNLLGSVSAIMAVTERLKAQGHGTLVVLSSVAGERVRKSNFPYGASKAGLDGFCQGLGDHLAGSGVHVMVVRPGFVHTKMTAGLDPAPLATTPAAVAAAIVQGLRRDADTVWVPAALRYVMVGLRHLPRTVFRRLEM